MYHISPRKNKNVTRKLAGLMYRVGPDRVGFLSEHLTVYPGSNDALRGSDRSDPRELLASRGGTFGWVIQHLRLRGSEGATP